MEEFCVYSLVFLSMCFSDFFILVFMELLYFFKRLCGVLFWGRILNDLFCFLLVDVKIIFSVILFVNDCIIFYDIIN